MTEANHCYENAQAERLNGILKGEFNLDAQFRTRTQARRAIAQAIATYNLQRPHLSLSMRTPQRSPSTCRMNTGLSLPRARPACSGGEARPPPRPPHR